MRFVELEENADETVIVLTFDGSIDDSSISDLRLTVPGPRHVITLAAIESPPSPSVRPVDSTAVVAVRFDVHHLEDSSRLHVLIDLREPGQTVRWRILGPRLVIRVAAPPSR